ncbi:aflatoxin B1 aldehyde reductase member 2 [Hyaloscypha variabilis]
MSKQINLIYGAVRLGFSGSALLNPKDATDETYKLIFEVLKKNGVNHLDTGRLHGNAEERLGLLTAGTDYGFSIDTKWVGGFFDPTSITKERIIADAKDSLSKLGVTKIHTFYLHSPFRNAEIEDTLVGINEAYKMGIFKHFGLSNFSPAQVQQVYDVCKANGLVLPTVYEGLYNPVNRKTEEELLPLLRKLGIRFNAYGVLAAGFLTKTREHVVNHEGRFSKDQFRGIYAKMYNNAPFLDAHDEWGRIANEEGVTRLELAYRWMSYHSSLRAELGDGILLGGRLGQLEETFHAIAKGALSEGAVEKIQKLWVKLEPHVNYIDNLGAMMQ